mmetsp:Transcript_15821/g.22204  ORF Transcript_15821/g.22204 Transcript_15821/m.22204 type:complete len:84 (-) Transcript_15821:126-377(-)
MQRHRGGADYPNGRRGGSRRKVWSSRKKRDAWKESQLLLKIVNMSSHGATKLLRLRGGEVPLLPLSESAAKGGSQRRFVVVGA